jgi:hypothetical protein
MACVFADLDCGGPRRLPFSNDHPPARIAIIKAFDPRKTATYTTADCPNRFR